MNDLKHLNAVANALIEVGYEVGLPKEGDDFLNVWGIVVSRGGETSKAFEEIYCNIIGVNGEFVSYWTTNNTYNKELESIEIESNGNRLRGIQDLIDSLSVFPLDNN